MLLFKMEGEHYHTWKTKAWEQELPMTPKKMDPIEDAFKDVNVWEF
jgi:hypothetical protein